MLTYLTEHEGAGLAELARVHGVSPVTIHRDLERLARDGLIERVHGGARALAAVSDDTAWARRTHRNEIEKRAIGQTAAKLVGADWSIFVDSSTTCLAFAQALAREPGLSLGIVTNSPAIAYRLKAPSIHVVLTPGDLNQELRLIAGSWTNEFLAKLHFHTAFMSGSGITPMHGLGSMTRPLADVLRTVRSVSDHAIALVDSSKFGRPSIAPIGRLDEFDLIVTDDGLPIESQSAYRESGAKLLIADAGATSAAAAAKAR